MKLQVQNNPKFYFREKFREFVSPYNPYIIAVYSLFFLLLLYSLAFLTKNSRYDDFKREVIVFQPNDGNQNIILGEGWEKTKINEGQKSISVKGKISKIKIFLKEVNTFYVELRLKIKNSSESSYSEEIQINGIPVTIHNISAKTDNWKVIPVFFTLPERILKPGWNELSISHSVSNPNVAFEKVKLLNYRGYSTGFLEFNILLDNTKYEFDIHDLRWPTFKDVASLALFFTILFLPLISYVLVFPNGRGMIIKYYFYSIISGFLLLTLLTLLSIISPYKIVFTGKSINTFLLIPVILCYFIYAYRHLSRVKIDFLLKQYNITINNFKQSRIIDNEFIVICLVLTMFLSIFFYRSILFGEINSASGILQESPFFQLKNENKLSINSLWGDPLQQTEPWRFFTMKSVKNGIFPLWNELQSSGIPHFANMQSAVLYPLNFFYYFFNVKLATFLFYFMKLFIIGIFTYLYLRELSFHRYTSIIGSIAFMFCGFNMVWLYWAHANVIFFLPASLLIIERAFKTNQATSIIKYFIVYSLLFAVAFFGGHPETLAHILFFTSCYFLYLLFSSNKELINKVKITAIFMGANIAGTLLSMIQLLPFLEYLSLSEKLLLRSNAEIYAGGSVFFMSIPNIIPDFYGNQAFGNGKLLPYYASPLNYNEAGGGYIGLFMMVFAFLGIKYFTKDRKIAFLWIMSIFILGVIYRIYPFSNMFSSLPFFKLAANHRMMVLTAFIFLTIGCKTFDDYYFKDIEIKSKNINILFIILVLLIIYYCFSTWERFPILLPDWGNINKFQIFKTQIITVSIWMFLFFCIKRMILLAKSTKYKNLIATAIPLFIFIETGIHGMFYVPTVKERYFYPKNPFIEKIMFDNSDHYRSTVKGVFFPTNVNVAYNLSDIRNYDAMSLLRYKEFINSILDYKGGDFHEITELNSTLLNLTGVKYLITDTEKMPQNYKLIIKNYDRGIFIHENTSVLNRAYIVNKYKVIKNDSEILENIKYEKVDLSKEVILEEYPPINFPNPLNNKEQTSKTSIVVYRSNLVKIETESNSPGFLVLSDNYFPGWKAFINGKETKIYRANYTFRAVPVPAGRHEVIFKYDPLSFKVGLYVSLVSILLLSAVFISITLLNRQKQG